MTATATPKITYQIDAFSKGYNGWTNYSTWNVALWLQNDESLYTAAMEAGNYENLLELLYDCGVKETRDGVSFWDPEVNVVELNSEVFDI
jgi:hypothetical protein